MVTGMVVVPSTLARHLPTALPQQFKTITQPLLAPLAMVEMALKPELAKQMALGVEPVPSTLALHHLLQLAILYLLSLPITMPQPQLPLQDHLVLVVIVAQLMQLIPATIPLAEVYQLLFLPAVAMPIALPH